MEAGPYDLVIFDNDGVLVDSERLAVRIDVEVLGEMGWVLTEEEVIERFVGRPHAHMTEQLALYLGRELPADWGEVFSKRYFSVFEAELTTVPGVVEAVDAIAAMVPAICVASSSSHRHLRFALGLTGLYERFEGRIFSARDVAQGKPAPDVFLHAAASMGVAPSRCAVVEDSVPGVTAGLAAGMSVYAFCGGVTPGSVLGAVDERVICFDDMADLPALLLKTA
jgi:HAD superfamily hydrolase (TIGR01509 family)